MIVRSLFLRLESEWTVRIPEEEAEAAVVSEFLFFAPFSNPK
jgi:hypothetical protein